MVPVPTSWEFASVVSKLFFYFGAASLVGGSACLSFYSDARRQTVQATLIYVALGAFLGFQAVLLNFLLQVGQVNDSGVAGMFDWDMASLLLDTQLGDATLVRLAGFVVALVASLVFLQRSSVLDRPPARAHYRLFNTANLLAFLLLVLGFRFSGHVAVLSSLAKLAIALHFLAFAAWIGSLYPLQRLAASPDPALLKSLMVRFGQDARFLLLALVVGGSVLLLELFQSPAEVVTSAYGLALLLKLLLVLAILAIAAVNKLRLVPEIESLGHGLRLRRAIRVEMGVALLILAVTAYFSTVVGPPSH